MRCVNRPLRGLRLGIVVLALSGCQSIRNAGTPSAVRPAPPAESNFSTALAFYSQGLIHELQRDVDAALDCYLESLRHDPDNEELYYRVSMGLIHLKRAPEAVRLMEDLVKRRPHSVGARRWLALIYRAAGENQKSAAAYQRLVRGDPSDVISCIQLASLYVSEDRADEAIRLLTGALRQNRQSPDLLRALGDVYLRNGSLGLSHGQADKPRQEAIRVFEQLAELAPRDLFILNKLGELYILNHQVDKAILCFETIERIQPDDLMIKQRLAESFLALGNKEKAVEVLEKIAREQPGNARIYYYLGELYRDLRDPDRALLNYNLAAQSDPDHVAAYMRMAMVQIENDLPGAIAALRKGLARVPDDPGLLEMISYAYFNNRQYPEAARSFEKTLKAFRRAGRDPVSPSLYFYYAVAVQHKGDVGKASELLQRAMDTNPSYVDAYIQLMLRQQDAGHDRVAIEVLEQLVGRQPDEPRIHYYLGMLYNYSKLYKQAIDSFGRTESLVADDAEHTALLNANFYFWYGAACEREGQFERAEQKFEECLLIDTNFAEAYNYLAYMWAEKGVNLDKALDYVQKALKLNPHSGAFIDTLGWIYYMQGKYEKALVEIRRASALIPDDPTITDHLGDILARLGQDDEALPQWKRSFMLDPDNEKVAEKLTRRGVDMEPLRLEAEEWKEKQEEEKARAAAEAASGENNEAAPRVPLDIPAVTAPEEPDEFPGLDPLSSP
jgi:tetratricopeptide (TPR) repeat protein